MSDRIPGSSWSNPIWHGEWRIYVCDRDAHCYGGFEYAFSHNDYDGAPDGNDSRHGHAKSLDEAREIIDVLEMETDTLIVREAGQ